LLFAADSVENTNELKFPYAYQFAKISWQTFKKLATFPFDIVVFGHGRAVSKSEFEKLAV